MILMVAVAVVAELQQTVQIRQSTVPISLLGANQDAKSYQAHASKIVISHNALQVNVQKY